MNAFESIIADFAKLTGLPLSSDERDGCILESDGIFFTIQYQAAADEVVIFAPVTDPDAAERLTKAMLEKALALAYKGKGTYGANLGMFNGELILSVQLPMQGLNAEALGVKLSLFADAAVSVRAEIAAAVAERNTALPPGERLSGQEMATLSRATSMFLVPSPRPDIDPKWGSVKDKRATMLDAIAYNLSRAEQAMNLGEGKHLSDAMVRHAALNMGLLDKQLVESILALSEKDYNSLLVEAQQRGGNLGQAISALRDDGRDLLTEVSTPPQVPSDDDDHE